MALLAAFVPRRRFAGDSDADDDGAFAIDLDVRDLIDEHVRGCGGDLSFAAFKASWISRSFSLVHNARLLGRLEGEHAQMLFSAALPHVAPSSGPDVRRVAALYALYLLYHTQPLMPPARVYITPRQARHLADLAEAAKRVGAKDALEALRALVDDGAFAIGAAESPREDELEETLQRAERGEIETATRESGERVRKKGGENRRRRGGSTAAAEGVGSDKLGASRQRDAVSDEGADADDPTTSAQCRVEEASRAALEHLRKTRVPESFARLSEDAAAYGDAMRAVMTAGGGGRGRATTAARAPTTSEMHELVRKQLVKYDGKLRAALRPETRFSAHPRALTAAEAVAEAADADEIPTQTRTLARLEPSGAPAAPRVPGWRTLAEATTFGSMPKLPGSAAAGSEREANESSDEDGDDD